MYNESSLIGSLEEGRMSSVLVTRCAPERRVSALRDIPLRDVERAGAKAAKSKAARPSVILTR